MKTTLILSLFSFNLWSQGEIATLREKHFHFKHSTCYIRVNLKEHPYKETLREQLKKKKLRPKEFVEDGRLFAGDLYLDLNIKKLKGKLFKDCQVKLKLKKAQNNRPNSKDPDLFSKTIVRAFPRLTFGGSERCSRAIKDAFVHVPVCQKKK